MKEVITAYWDEGRTSFIEQRGELIRCKYCKYGKPMCKPWDDIVCTQNNATHCPDWYCADGEMEEEK